MFLEKDQDLDTPHKALDLCLKAGIVAENQQRRIVMSYDIDLKTSLDSVTNQTMGLDERLPVEMKVKQFEVLLASINRLKGMVSLRHAHYEDILKERSKA